MRHGALATLAGTDMALSQTLRLAPITLRLERSAGRCCPSFRPSWQTHRGRAEPPGNRAHPWATRPARPGRGHRRGGLGRARLGRAPAAARPAPELASRPPVAGHPGRCSSAAAYSAALTVPWHTSRSRPSQAVTAEWLSASCPQGTPQAGQASGSIPSAITAQSSTKATIGPRSGQGYREFSLAEGTGQSRRAAPERQAAAAVRNTDRPGGRHHR